MVIVWCTIWVALSYDCDTKACRLQETAAKGRILTESEHKYLVDFSDYALLQGYKGDLSQVAVDKDDCVKE